MRLPFVRVALGLAAGGIVSACLLAPARTWAQASSPATAPAAPTAAGKAKAKLDEIVTGLAANAVLWRQDKPIEGAPEIALKTFDVDEKTLPLLEDVLAATKANDPNSMYVASRLLRQLSFATTHAIQTALPAAKSLSARVKYQTFPHLTDAQLKALKKPTDSSPKAQEALEDRRAKKLEADKAIAKHNEISFIVEMWGYKLMLQSQSVAEDKLLTAALIKAGNDKTDLFLALLDALAADARYMSEERAKAIYDTLRPKALEVKLDPKVAFTCLGKAAIHEDDNSVPEVRSEYPGLAMLKVINRIAGPAKEPAMKVPTEKEIAKAQGTKTPPTPPTPAKKDKARGG
jgi:hypothetical protein